MADWKYVMWEANGAKVPIIFPGTLIHSEVVRFAGRAVRDYVIAAQPNNWSSKVISAGHVSSLLVMGVYGRSDTLKLSCADGDRAIINTWPYCGGREDVLNIESMMFEAIKRNMK